MIRRFVAAASILVVGAALLVAAWPQLFGLQQTIGPAQLVSLRGFAAAVALVGVVAATIGALLAYGARRFLASLALMLLVFVAVTAAVLSTRGFGNLAFTTENSSDVTVLSWNTLGDAPGAETVARLALDEGADVITLPETTNEFGKDVAIIMQGEGRPMWVYTLAYDEISKARSTTLLVSTDLGSYEFDATATTTSQLPTIVATPRDGSGPTIIAVHAVAPLPGEMSGWRGDLDWLAAACVGDNVIAAGDFNATVDHMTGLAASPEATLGACRDAGLASGNGAVGTWPTMLPALLGAPIDHVMFTDNWHVSGMRVVESHDKEGSDHRPVIVQLSPSS